VEKHRKKAVFRAEMENKDGNFLAGDFKNDFKIINYA
jgi:hypothetical protein